jgi:RNA polymerase sigma-70 factor, ECF subfamily
MSDQNKGISIYSDEELMTLIRQGKVDAFDELYRRYSQRLMVYFVRMLNFNKAQAEDALQDLFTKIVEKPTAFDPSRSFKTWIYSVAFNCCKNYYRHKEVVKKNEAEMFALESHNDHFYNLAARLDARSFRRMLDELLETLSPEKKEAFLLKYQEDWTITEIAQLQNCPEGSVKSRLHYTIKLLEEKLKIFDPIKS